MSAYPALAVSKRPPPRSCSAVSTTSIVTDILWGSTPMITPLFLLLICSPRLVAGADGRRGGHCYYELGRPLWSHSSSRWSTSRSPDVSHTRNTGGQPQ